MSALVVFAVAAAASFGLRASMVVVGGDRVSEVWTARLPLVPPVMLSAIVASRPHKQGPVGTRILTGGVYTGGGHTAVAHAGHLIAGVNRGAHGQGQAR